MSDANRLYRSDFVLWSKEQAAALRAAARDKSNQKLDWENIAEEIESLGISQLRELKSQIRRIIEHLLKLENSRAADPRPGWMSSVRDARNEIESVLEHSPSLKSNIPEAIAAEMKRGSRKVIEDLRDYGELDRATLARIRSTTYSDDQILGDWLPPQSTLEP
ncbi:MAG: DUF29 domain-containing protein [Thiohalocapsa sp.]